LSTQLGVGIPNAIEMLDILTTLMHVPHIHTIGGASAHVSTYLSNSRDISCVLKKTLQLMNHVGFVFSV